jgi:amino acid permease
LKLYFGIAMLGVPQGFSHAGIYGGLIGLLYIGTINIFCAWLLIKARNKFKNKSIKNLSDLAMELYGERGRMITDLMNILTMAVFLVAYNIYLGEQSDQIVCKTLKIAKCGHSVMYAFLFNIVLVPIFLQKQMKSIAYFSMFCLMTMVISIVLTFILQIDILRHDPSYAVEKYGLDLKPINLEYTKIDWL